MIQAPSPSLPDRFRAGLATSLRARFVAAMGLVLVCLAVRLALEPIVGTAHGYTLFYPAVILSAYWLGSRPAVLATVVSAAIVYLFMGEGPVGPKTEPRALLALTVFLLATSLIIGVLAAIRSRLEALALNHARMAALVRGQAALFRDHAQRVGDHLQLVSAILQSSARTQDDRATARVLTNAASRTLMISRTQRAFAGQEAGEIAFRPFAQTLAQAADAPVTGRVIVEGDEAAVPVEQAAAVGLILLEYVTTLNELSTPWTLRIGFDDGPLERVVTFLAEGDTAMPEPENQGLVVGLVEQLGGRLLITRGERNCGIRLAFPIDLPVPSFWQPLGVTLH